MSRAVAPVRTDVGTRPRSRTERLVDATSTRLFHLPPERGSYSVTPAIRVRMRDGVHLLTDHYAPDGPALGTVVMRGPYQRAGAVPHILLGLFASRGYHVVMQSCRGTFGSEGRFVPGEDEIRDGADTVEWLREQPWFEGRFVGVGGSYLSYTLWSMLMEPPPEMVAAVSFVSFHDFFGVVHGSTGAFTLNDILDWCDSLAIQEDATMLRQLVDGRRIRRRRTAAYLGLPVRRGRNASSGRGPRGSATGPLAPTGTTPTGRCATCPPPWTGCRSRCGSSRGGRTCSSARPSASTGGCATAGWRCPSLLARGPTRTCSPRAAHGCSARPSNGSTATSGGPSETATSEPVSYLLTGADEWRSAADWPPPAVHHTLFLAPGGVLTDRVPAASAGAVGFTYDPSNPTPTIGGRLLAVDSGYREDSDLARRADVLVFAGEALSEPLDVVGVPRVTLAHRSDNAGGDLWVRVSEVHPDGRSHNVTETFRAAPAPGADGRTVLELDPVAHRFAAGSRIGLLIGGGSFPRYARNLGMPGSRTEGTSMRPTRQAVDLADGASALSLPLPT